MNILYAVLIGLAANFILFFFDKSSIWIQRKFKNKTNGFIIYNNPNGKTKVFLKNEKEVRVTIGVIANIRDTNNRLLVIYSNRDGQWKPVGGAIKLDDNLKSKIKKLSCNNAYTEDVDTKYKAKPHDFRLMMPMKNNLKLLKILFSLEVDYM